MVQGFRYYLESKLDIIDSFGSELYAVCPYCSKSGKHFSCNINKCVFHCFKCGAKGSYITLLHDLEGLPYNESVVKKFLSQYGEDLSLEELEEQTIIDPIIKEPYHSVIKLKDEVLGLESLESTSKGARRAVKYLVGRRADVDLLITLGAMVGVSGEYEGYILIPLWEDGLIVNFVGRAFSPDLVRYTGPHKDSFWRLKSTLLFGYDWVKLGQEKVVLVEGSFDALALHKKFEGLTKWEVCAILGTNTSCTQVRKLAEKKVKEVVITFDIGVSLKLIHESVIKLIGFIPTVTVAFLGEEDPAENPQATLKAIEERVDYFEID